MNLLRTKTIEQSIEDTKSPSTAACEPHARPARLVVFGVGVIIGTGIFVLTGKAAGTLAGPAIALSFVVAAHRLRAGRALLRRVRLHRPGRRLGLHLLLREPRRAGRLDHRLGPDPRARARRRDGGLGLVGLLPRGLPRHPRREPAHVDRRRRTTTSSPRRSCSLITGAAVPRHQGLDRVNLVIVAIKVAIVLLSSSPASLHQEHQLPPVHPPRRAPRRRPGGDEARRCCRTSGSAPAPSASAASSPARRWCSSPSSASTSSPPRPRRRKSPSATCRSASSARWPSARSCTWPCRSW